MVQLCTVIGLKTVSFGTSIIQKSRRVALDPNLLDTLELKEGDKVRIELDIDTATILIRKAVAAAASKRGRSGSRDRAPSRSVAPHRADLVRHLAVGRRAS